MQSHGFASRTRGKSLPADGPIILNSPSILIQVDIATRLGLNEALLLSHFYCRLQMYEEDRIAQYFEDGHYWIRATVAEMQKTHFPMWSAKTIRRTLARLRAIGALIVRRAPQGATEGDRFTINTKVVGEIDAA